MNCFQKKWESTVIQTDMPCIPRIQSNIDGDFDQGKSLKYELSHGTRLQPRKIEVLAITRMEGFTMKHWNVWNCMDMGSRLGKVHIANLLNMIFLGVSSCCPFSSVNWALVFHRLGHAFVALGGWAASVGRAGTRARHFPASGGGPFGRALTWTYWMARSGGREPKTW